MAAGNWGEGAELLVLKRLTLLQEHNVSTSHLELLVMSYGGLVKCVEEHLNHCDIWVCCI
jgi:hypothetical protein